MMKVLFFVLMLVFVLPTFGQTPRRKVKRAAKPPVTQIEGVTMDGRAVILRSDGTWKYEEETPKPAPDVPAEPAGTVILKPADETPVIPETEESEWVSIFDNKFGGSKIYLSPAKLQNSGTGEITFWLRENVMNKSAFLKANLMIPKNKAEDLSYRLSFRRADCKNNTGALLGSYLYTSASEVSWSKDNFTKTNTLFKPKSLDRLLARKVCDYANKQNR